jgi:hypothetical protein
MDHCYKQQRAKQSGTRATMLNVQYRIKGQIIPPRSARWRLIFWGYVVFFSYKKPAEEWRDSLPYYQQEDSELESIR